MSSPVTRADYKPVPMTIQQHNLLLAYCVLSMSQYKYKGYCDSLDLDHKEITEWAKEVIRNVKTANTHEVRDVSGQVTLGSRRHDTEPIRDILGRLPK